jgi:hypothetical protein
LADEFGQLLLVHIQLLIHLHLSISLSTRRLIAARAGSHGPADSQILPQTIPVISQKWQQQQQ